VNSPDWVVFNRYCNSNNIRDYITSNDNNKYNNNHKTNNNNNNNNNKDRINDNNDNKSNENTTMQSSSIIESLSNSNDMTNLFIHTNYVKEVITSKKLIIWSKSKPITRSMIIKYFVSNCY
jgi:hypothetical protein